MRNRLTTLALLTAGIALASGVNAKTLVYCSEGSPENFNPQLYTSGTSVDAITSNSRVISCLRPAARLTRMM